MIVQNYNALLSLSHLYHAADALLVMSNDELQTICAKMMNIKKASMEDLNRVLAQHLCQLMLPSTHTIEATQVDTSATRKSKWIFDLIDHLACHPTYKLLNMRCIPQVPDNSISFTSYKWSPLLKRLFQMHLTQNALEEGLNWNISVEQSPKEYINKCVGNLLIVRGSELADGVDLSLWKKSEIYAQWNPTPFAVWHNSANFAKHEKSALLVSNSQTIIKPLDKILGKAFHMYSANAYLHQYENHQLSKQDFEQSFVELEAVLESYKKL